MDTSQNLDSLITKYCDDLMQMKEKWSKWGIETQKSEEKIPKAQFTEESHEKEEDTTELTQPAVPVVALSQDQDITQDKRENEENSNVQEDNEGLGEGEGENENEEEKEKEKDEKYGSSIPGTGEINPAPISDVPVADPENSATFIARVFSGEEAYPIDKAKVMLYLDKKLHSFLITNENGETPEIKIQSAPAENALIPNSENQELDYSADVFAEGFTSKKGLLVSAVGNSKILLTVQLTPVSERID